MKHFEIGQSCPYCKIGTLYTLLDGGCSCHIHPPCGYCVEKNSNLSCDNCGEDPYEDISTNWEVVKYWDDIYDGIVASNLTENEAIRKANSFKRSIYTTYGVRKMEVEKKTFLEWLGHGNNI